MTDVPQVGDLEIAQDLSFQHTAWRAQRIGWVIIALIVIAAVLGLFGSGPLSSASAGRKGDPLWVEYGRTARFKAPASLVFHVTPGRDANGTISIQISREYLQAVQIEQIMPQPEQVVVGAEDVTYVFSVARSGEPLIVTINLQPQQIGMLSANAGQDGGSFVTFNQFVYP